MNSAPINLWVADGIPRGGFLAATLPMEDLHSKQLDRRHREAQHERGGHHPEALGDPLLISPRDREPSDAPHAAPRARTRRARTESAKPTPGGQRPPETTGPYGPQLVFGDPEPADTHDEL